MSHWIFVWTIGDIASVIVFGSAFLFFGGLLLLLWIDYLWFKWTGLHLPYNRPK